MFFNKKGTELSMNVIIIAAIAILVLVILAMFLFGTINDVDEGKSCKGIGGTCMASCTGNNPLPYISLDDTCGTAMKCCLPVGSK